ncbi:hypothetical protein [Citrobacter freundii]|uniref:hypothetical protein n=1 Tax=Citrobacter freundii TaxID=546 RepID=UPI000FD8621C|nr:hypothetical protein [Citrobacter freundii]ELK6103823.1 hypothetical protein [Citrobacter freundii]MDT7293311.1 hypothetical protein [Citrobacter freundii]MDT7417173.1 hypothetical protein [Citrobacter freundii]RVR97348.1 hypothetical protein EOL15_25035 [Citrobacter freundii]
MSVQRREVYLVLKQLSDGRLFYVEGLRSARMYFFDGHVRVLTSPGGSASFIEFEPAERPIQLFHLPDEEGSQWQAAFHDFGCSPELGKPELEYVIFVGAYSDDRERTIELMNMGMTHAWEIIEGKCELREGEFEEEW